MRQGILYIATDEEFREEAKFSAQKVKNHMDVPITLITDTDISSDIFDSVLVDDDPRQSFSDKPRNLLKSPYDRTLYLDTDVYILRDISEIFDLLDNFDVAAAVDPNEWELRFDKQVDYGDIPESLPVYQTGVFAYRQTEPTTNLLQRWRDIHLTRNITRDQASFRIAVLRSDANITALSSNYNCLVGWPMQVSGEVKAIHDTLGHINNNHQLSAVDEAINDSLRPRLLYNFGDEVHLPQNPNIDKVIGTLHKKIRNILSKLV